MAFTRKAPNMEVCLSSGTNVGVILAFCTYFIFNQERSRHLKMFLHRYTARNAVNVDKLLPVTVSGRRNLLYWLQCVWRPELQMLQENISHLNQTELFMTCYSEKIFRSSFWSVDRQIIHFSQFKKKRLKIRSPKMCLWFTNWWGSKVHSISKDDKRPNVNPSLIGQNLSVRRRRTL